MPCACQKGKTTTEYVYVARNGTEKVYPSEIQARAAVIREGGGKVVPRTK